MLLSRNDKKTGPAILAVIRLQQDFIRRAAMDEQLTTLTQM
jgi:hypothetical protein